MRISDWSSDVCSSDLYICDRDGRVVDYNKAAAELWGRAPERSDPGVRFCGSHRLLSLRGETIPHDACPMAQALATGEALRDEAIISSDIGNNCAIGNAYPTFEEEIGRAHV